MLSEIDDFESVEDVTDALGTILLESHEEATQEIVNEVCATLFSSLKGLVNMCGRMLNTKFEGHLKYC